MSSRLTQSTWETMMCEKILILIRDELFLDFRYFDRAFHALSFVREDRLSTFAVDGNNLYYSSEQLMRLIRSNPLFLNRAFLHGILHCLFLHPWIRGKRQQDLYDLACDICVESLIDSFEKPSVRRLLSGIRISLYRDLKEASVPVSAAGIYHYLTGLTEETISAFAGEFFTDDHRFWPKEAEPSPVMMQTMRAWERTGSRAFKEMELKGDQGGEEAALSRLQVNINGMRHSSYEEFLRKFTSLHEELHIDPDEFDLGYYTYGLRLYRSMPLIEPLESREIMKIREFVIVIDTSYSTSGTLVRNFLRKTFDILCAREHFFDDSHVLILQCDDEVRSCFSIRGEDDIETLFREFTLTGGGLTDFRPAFRYIQKLREQGELRQLKGMLYFTDGMGTFPAAGPDYTAAFVFIGRNREHVVPSWAVKTEFDEEDFL